VRLPARLDAVRTRPAPVRTRRPHSAIQTERRSSGERAGTILVVDDDETGRSLVARIVDRAGYDCVEADSVADGLECLDAVVPDAIVLDIQLPDQPGWALLAALRDRPAVAHVPVIIASVIDSRYQSLERGAVEHLTKPLVAQQLVTALERWATRATSAR
jgi:CheY-like chemotaxis protein